MISTLLLSILLFTMVFSNMSTCVCLSLLVPPLPFSYYCISIFATGCQASLQPSGFVALSVTFSSLGSPVHLFLSPIAWHMSVCVRACMLCVPVCVCLCAAANSLPLSRQTANCCCCKEYSSPLLLCAPPTERIICVILWEKIIACVCLWMYVCIFQISIVYRVHVYIVDQSHRAE